MVPYPPALLALANGLIFHGHSIGVAGIRLGETVFNTAMTGYQEILTDPSYCQQIITLTYPHIGNTGTNLEDNESSVVLASGLIIRDLPPLASSWRKKQTLAQFLQQHNIVAIAGVDTRNLTRILRDQGSQAGCIMSGEIDENHAITLAQSFEPLSQKDLVKKVSCQKPYLWQTHALSNGQSLTKDNKDCYHIVAFDYGIKPSMLQILASQGCKITVVPATTSAVQALQYQPDGIFLSNGPGDPQACSYAIDTIKQLLKTHLPIFGVCLGHQLLGLAAGARTIKMKFGHHGANHPVQDLKTGKVAISSQNHGFELDEHSLPSYIAVTHRSLFDQSVQGICFIDKPVFGFQGHPEANPGPNDMHGLFDQFVLSMKNHLYNN